VKIDIDNNNIISTKEIFASIEQYMREIFEANPPPVPQNPQLIE
jgi:hypothetical protein